MANRPCPKCRERGDDSTGDHLYRALEGKKYLNYFICRKCGYRENIRGEPMDAIEEPEEKTPSASYKLSCEEISELPAVTDRGIHSSIRKMYGVTTERSPEDRSIVKHFYPVTSDTELLTYKYRDCRPETPKKKKFGRIGKVGNDIDLFGQAAAKGTPKILLITEGEEDAMAAQQMLRGKVHGIHCVSLTDGTGSVKSLANNIEWVHKAHKIYFCPDNDKAGKAIIESVAMLIDNLYIIEDLTEKDANDMLLKKKHEEFAKCYFNARKYTPPFLVTVKDAKADALKRPEMGRPWPWPTLNSMTYGMRDGEGIYVGAGVKIGKSEFIDQLVYSSAMAGHLPAIAKFEQKPGGTLKRLASKHDGILYHKPDVEYRDEDLEKTLDLFDDKLFMYKAFGQANWNTVKLWIRYVVSEGSKLVIIDPLTKLTNHLDSSATETELRRIADELACMAHDLGFFYVCTCHLKAPPAGKKPHEEGGKVHSNQFRGSRAMMENCYMFLGIERDKSPDLPEEVRNTSTFVLLENREYGTVGRFNVFYDRETGSYLEPKLELKHLGGD